jgi:hypothetical protein
MAQVVLALEMDVQGPVQIVVIVAILLVRCQANIFHFYNSSPETAQWWRMVGLVLKKRMAVRCCLL